MIERTKSAFWLQTAHTTYAFRVMDSGQLEHLYYGRRLLAPGGGILGEDENGTEEALAGKHRFGPGNSIQYREELPGFSLEEPCLEMSALGKGDIREPFLEIVHGDGSTTSDFVYRDFYMDRGKPPFKTLPGSFGTAQEIEHLCVTLTDRSYGLDLELHYYVYEERDVIARSARLINCSDREIGLRRMMSLQIDFDGTNFDFTTFGGAWARERK